MQKIIKQINTAAKTISSAVTGRAFCCCALALALSAIITFASQQINLVYIRDRGVTVTKYTIMEEPDAILKAMGYSTGKHDRVRFSGFSSNTGVIDIDRAFAVTVAADGRSTKLMTTGATVGELLDKQGIKLREYDEINMPLSKYVSANDEIEVNRVDIKTTVEYEKIDYEVEYKYNCLLRNGRQRTLIQGQQGERKITYVERIVDGQLQEKQKVESEITKKPVTQLVLIGSDDPVSKLDFGVELNANGVPVKYQKVLTNQICTGYSAFKGAKGASRMVLEPGYVAVRANQIPYGTKMYITSPDNKFVYGFAIAADTGVGLMQNIIDIDLFYDTYRESALNGRKYLNVYIL